MEHKDFTLAGGFKVKVFLNGDFKMFDFVMGHQESTSYPGITDLVTLNYLKTHSGTPNTSENLKIELREISDFFWKIFCLMLLTIGWGLLIRKRNISLASLGLLLFPQLLF